MGDTTTQDCYDKQVGTHPKEIYVTECKIDYVEECPEPSYGRVKRDTSEDEEENSRVKRQSQSCFGSNCNQNNFGGFPQFVPQQPFVPTFQPVIPSANFGFGLGASQTCWRHLQPEQRK